MIIGFIHRAHDFAYSRYAPHMIRAVPVLLVLALVGACGNCDDAEFSVDNVCSTAVRAECHFLFSCCVESERDQLQEGIGGAGQTGTIFLLGSDEQSCVDFNSKESCERYTRVSESVAAGRFAYDDDKAAACWRPFVDAADQCDINEYAEQAQRSFARICDPFAGVGLVKVGGECFVNEECQDGGQCVRDQSTNPAVAEVTARGTCGAAPPAPGEACPADGFCGLDAICSNGLFNGEGEGEGEGGPPPPPPPPATCGALFADGQPCGEAQECASGLCGGRAGSVCGRSFTDGEDLELCKGPR
jgi:hypothetical protein